MEGPGELSVSVMLGHTVRGASGLAVVAAAGTNSSSAAQHELILIF